MKYLRYGRVLRVLVLPLLVSSLATAQFLPSADLSLEKLNFSAGTVFSGTVIQIEHAIGTDAKPAFVRVKFRVDQAVRGCNAGDSVAMDEWAGLWNHGYRYRKGQRVVIFLHPPSQAGFSSPIAGDFGIFNIGPEGLLRTRRSRPKFSLRRRYVRSLGRVLPILTHRKRTPDCGSFLSKEN